MGLVDRILRSAQLDAAAPLLDTKELVEVVVSFPTDRISWRDLHQGELGVIPGERNGTEVVVVERELLDISDPTKHASLPVRKVFRRLCPSTVDATRSPHPVNAATSRFRALPSPHASAISCSEGSGSVRTLVRSTSGIGRSVGI